MKTLLVTGTLAVVAAVTGASATVAADQRTSALADASPEQGEHQSAEKQAAEDAEKAERRAAQEAFVAAKQAWSDCVSDAAPEGEAAFDPEEACGARPRNPRAAAGHGSTKDADGPPPWSGGPGQRSEEPPGQVRKDA